MAQVAHGPPSEAERQPDGSYLLSLDDGSTKRWTKRLDGSWRKPEHRRAGFVGELERKKYVPPGAPGAEEVRASALLERELLERTRMRAAGPFVGAGAHVPDLPPGAGGLYVPGAIAPARASQAQRSERNREGRRESTEAREHQRRAEPAAAAAPGRGGARPAEEALPQRPQGAGAARLLRSALAPASRRGAAAAWLGDEPRSPGSAAADAKDPHKDRRTLEKKLRQVADLEERHAQGERLDADQLQKMASRLELERQLSELQEPPTAGSSFYHSAGTGGVPPPFPGGR